MSTSQGRGKRPLETDASWNQHNKKLRVGDVCLGVFDGETTFVKLLQPVAQHDAFSVLVLGKVPNESPSRRHVPVTSLRPLPEIAGQSIQLQTPTKMWLQSTPRGPSAQNTPVAVPVTVLSYCDRQLAVEYHGLEFSVPFERLLSEPSVLPTDSWASRSRMLALVTSRPRLVAAVAVGTTATVVVTAVVVVGGLGFLATWHAASAVLPEVSLPHPPGHPPSLLGLVRCSSSCTSHQLGRVRAIVANALSYAHTLLGLLISGCAQLFLPTHNCMPDPQSLRRFHHALYNLHSAWWYGFNGALLKLGEVVLYGALASWDLNALAVLGLIVANATAYLPLHDKQRQNLRSVGLRADNFSPARVLSACFAHADPMHLLNNVRKAVSNHSESRAPPPQRATLHPPSLVAAAPRTDGRRRAPAPRALVLERARARLVHGCGTSGRLRLRLPRPTPHVHCGRERRHLRPQDGHPCAHRHGQRGACSAPRAPWTLLSCAHALPASLLLCSPPAPPPRHRRYLPLLAPRSRSGHS